MPDLALSWTQPDPKTYVFQLRKGVLFHNGREMKAADVKFSLERIQGLGGRSKWYTLILDLERVEVLDDYRVRLNLKQPSAPFLANLAFATIVAQENVEKIGLEPVGTGPFNSSSACRTPICSSGVGESSTCPASPRWTRSAGCR